MSLPSFSLGERTSPSPAPGLSGLLPTTASPRPGHAERSGPAPTDLCFFVQRIISLLSHAAEINFHLVSDTLIMFLSRLCKGWNAMVSRHELVKCLGFNFLVFFHFIFTAIPAVGALGHGCWVPLSNVSRHFSPHNWSWTAWELMLHTALSCSPRAAWHCVPPGNSFFPTWRETLWAVLQLQLPGESLSCARESECWRWAPAHPPWWDLLRWEFSFLRLPRERFFPRWRSKPFPLYSPHMFPLWPLAFPAIQRIFFSRASRLAEQAHTGAKHHPPQLCCPSCEWLWQL